MKILIISPWFGPRPAWWTEYVENVRQQTGFDWYFPADVVEFRNLVRETLDVETSIRPGTGKIHDFRPCFGEIYAKEIESYDWWGHTDLDCVYGRLEHFYTEELLAELDLYTDCNDYVCGPWTLYRNCSEVNSAFREHAGWEEMLTHPQALGWIEMSFSRMVETSSLRYEFRQQHAYSEEQFLLEDEGLLFHRGVEIPFFHFRYSKHWPLAGPAV